MDMTQMPWIQWLDLDTELGSDGTVRVIMQRPKAEHLNHNGHVNAPVIYGVAEVAGAGAVVMAAGEALAGAYTVIKTAAIEYRRPARSGITASATMDPQEAEHMRDELRAGRGYDANVEVLLTDSTETDTGTCRFAVSLRPRHNL